MVLILPIVELCIREYVFRNRDNTGHKITVESQTSFRRRWMLAMAGYVAITLFIVWRQRIESAYYISGFVTFLTAVRIWTFLAK